MLPLVVVVDIDVIVVVVVAIGDAVVAVDAAHAYVAAPTVGMAGKRCEGPLYPLV
jgi:hypothetical protein